MARHRNVRKLNYDEECDFDDVYGRSVEDAEYCISPGTAAEFMYDRTSNTHSMSAFIQGDHDHIPEENLESEEEAAHHEQKAPLLSDLDEGRLRSCLDELHNIVGDSIPEGTLISAVVTNDFNVERALNAVLNSQAPPEAPKPQRERRERRPREGAAVKTNSTSSQTPIVATSATTTMPAVILEESKQQRNVAIIGGVENVTKSVTKLSVNSDKAIRGFSPQPETPPPIGKSASPQMPRANNLAVEENDVRLSPNLNAQRLGQRGLGGTTPITSQGQSKIDAAAEYERQRGGGKELLNLVVIGHVDAGKSTLMGHLLWLLGAVSKKAMHKYEQESKKIGKASFMFAWVLDETGEERSRGITMDVGQSKFETDSKVVTLLDAPGHKDFIPNMITGASQADVAILVVNASRGEFETGFELGGQTREHALLVRSLGVFQLVVVVNKLDTVNWSLERFTEITKKLGLFLKQAGFKDSDVTYVPCSGLTGENLKEPPKEAALRAWYKGPTLLKQIDSFKPPERPVSKPFRMSVDNVFKGQGSGFCVSGRIETGVLQNADRVLVMPQGEQAQIKGITIDEMSVTSAFAGDHAVVNLSNIDMTNVNVGCILCDPAQPIRTTTCIQARIVVFNIDIPITNGFPVVFHYQSLCEPAVIKKLVSQLHKSTGEVVKKKPKCLVKQSSAIIVLEVSRPICIELYKDIKELGRFMLRSGSSTIAAGLVTEIL